MRTGGRRSGRRMGYRVGSKGSHGFNKARGPFVPGVRFAMRLAILCMAAVLVVFWVMAGQLHSRHGTHLQVDDVRDSALSRIFGEHGEEIQQSVRENWQWFRQYLLRLRHHSRVGHSGVDDEEEEDAREVERVLQDLTVLSHSSPPSSHPQEKRGLINGDGLSRKDLRSGSGEGKRGKEEVGTGTGRGRGGVPETLNNLDMPMRKIHGKLQACLDLLPPEQLEHLEFPPPSPPGTLSQLRYYEVDDEAREIEEAGGGVERGRGLALDLFAGKQSMSERTQSYQVADEMEVHCGFAGKDTGFDVSDEDQRFLDGCHVAVVTAAFGGGDTLAQPIGMTQASLEKVCYVAFWDDVTLKSEEREGVVPDAQGKVGVWRIVLVRNLPFSDQRRNGKIPKILLHRLLPHARWSIWVDSKYQFRRDPLGVLEALLWRRKREFAISEHGARGCVYSEGEAVVRKHKATPEEVAVQLNQYRAEGLPPNASYKGHKALAEASVIVREHNFVTNLFMCLWFNENVRFTPRDQLSFPYVLRRLDLLDPYMFSVCTRRALVNKLGHKRKAKPLQTVSL